MLSLMLVAASAVLGAGLTAGEIEEAGSGYVFTEGPVWLSSGSWVFSDTQQGKIFNEDGSVYHDAGTATNGLILDESGRLLACDPGNRRVIRMGTDGADAVVAEAYQGKGLNGPNDIVVHSNGTIFFTDPKPFAKDFVSETGISGVYSVPAGGGEPTLITDTIKYPNGIAFSPDERTLYVSDTGGAGMFAFDVASDGAVSGGRKFCDVRIPDGMAVDAQGNVWSTSSAGIVVYAPDGNELERFRVPVMPTNCAFGGPDGKTLFITARKRVFKIRTEVAGVGHAKAK